MKIGFTSQNYKSITGHAGKSRRFIIYSVNNLMEIIELKRLNLPKELSMHEFKGQTHPLDELDVLITAGCGKGFIQKMLSRQVTVIATSEEEPLTAVKSYIAGKQLPPAKPHHH